MDILRALPTQVKTLSNNQPKKSLISSMKGKLGVMFQNKKLISDVRLQVAKDRWRKLSTLRKALGTKPFKSLGSQKLGRKSTALFASSDQVIQIQKQSRKNFIIYPGDSWKGIFDFIISILILYFCLIVPVRIGFTLEAVGFWYFLELFFDFLFAIDIILRFRCAYLENTEVVDIPKKIASRYFKSWFAIDFISTFPFQLLDNQMQFAKLGRLLRIMRISKLFRLTRLFRSSSITQLLTQSGNIDFHQIMYITRMAKFLFSTVILVHLFACFWNFVSEGTEHPWYDRYGYQNYTQGEKYIGCLYWVITTWTTVGYGDIHPFYIEEIIFTIFVQFIGIAFFAYLMGNVSSMVADYQNKKNRDTSRQDNLDLWVMKTDRANPTKKLPAALHKQINELFTYLWSQETTFIKEYGFLSKIPYNLRNQVLQHIFQDLIKFYEILFKGCEDNFKYDFILSLMPHQYQPNDYIIYAYKPVFEMYLVTKGQIIVSYKDLKFLTLYASSFIGEHYIILNCIPAYNYQAGSDGLNVMTITKSKFVDLLEEYPQTFNQFTKIANERRIKFLKLRQEVVEKHNEKHGWQNLTRNSKMQDIKKKMDKAFGSNQSLKQSFSEKDKPGFHISQFSSQQNSFSSSFVEKNIQNLSAMILLDPDDEKPKQQNEEKSKMESQISELKEDIKQIKETLNNLNNQVFQSLDSIIAQLETSKIGKNFSYEMDISQEGSDNDENATTKIDFQENNQDPFTQKLISKLKAVEETQENQQKKLPFTSLFKPKQQNQQSMEQYPENEETTSQSESTKKMFESHEIENQKKFDLQKMNTIKEQTSTCEQISISMEKSQLKQKTTSHFEETILKTEQSLNEQDNSRIKNETLPISFKNVRKNVQKINKAKEQYDTIEEQQEFKDFETQNFDTQKTLKQSNLPDIHKSKQQLNNIFDLNLELEENNQKQKQKQQFQKFDKDLGQSQNVDLFDQINQHQSTSSTLNTIQKPIQFKKVNLNEKQQNQRSQKSQKKKNKEEKEDEQI